MSAEKDESLHSLDTLEPGQRAVVVRLQGEGPLRRRLMEMGMTPGSQVEALREAPLGDPMLFRLKGYALSMRRSEARLVLVNQVEEAPRNFIPLLTALPGKDYLVVSLNAGRGFSQRMLGLGLVPGAKLTVVEQFCKGRMLVRISGREQPLNRGMALKIMVSPQLLEKEKTKSED